MKTIITLSALALMSNLALAESFNYEEQIGSQDLDPNISDLSASVTDPEVSTSDFRISLNDFYSGNPDVAHVSYKHEGKEMQFKGDMLTSYDAWSQGNPDVEV